MSKSSKKRRQALKRKKELDRLRGVSLLDSASPVRGFLELSPNPENAEHLKSYGKSTLSPQSRVSDASNGPESSPVNNQPAVANESAKVAATAAATTEQHMDSSNAMSTKRIDFVLPRAKGKQEPFYFKQKQVTGPISDELPTIPEDDENGQSTAKRKTETLEDILYADKKKRKLADKFEAVYRDEELKKEAQAKNHLTTASAASTNGIRTMETNPTTVAKPKEGSGEKDKVHSVSEMKPRKSSVGPDKEVRNAVSDKEGNGERRQNKSVVRVDPAVRAQMDLVHRQLSGRSVEEAVKDKHGLRPRANSTDGELNLPQRGLCDEQMVLRAHRWKDEHIYVHQVAPKGLVNLGNTCFLNSILQCLAYLPPFFQSLIEINETISRQDKSVKKLSQGQRITASLCSLFQKVHRAGQVGEGSIAPQSIVKALPSLGSCGSRNGYKFRPGRQEDAHEFLVHLLDAMHDGELRAAGINQHASGWRDRLPASRLDETTFVHRIFGGYFRSQVRCKSCGYRSNTYDPFLDLSLEVSKKSSNSVLYALAEFTRKETLDSNNQWKCSKCKKYVCPTKQLTVFRPPLSLCIQLKRFAFDAGLSGRSFSSFGAGGSWKYGKSNATFRGGSKITKPIEFPADLDVPLSDGRSCAYTLTGVVVHVGGSASSGHYTAYVKTPGRKGQAQWFHADDSFVEPVSEKTVLRQKDAYILFYCRKEVKLEFPQPPPRDMSTEEAMEFGRARARARANSNASLQDTNDGEDHSKKAAALPPTSPPLQPQYGPPSDGTVTLTKTSFHPLTDMLNATMSSQFKAAKAASPQGQAKGETHARVVEEANGNTKQSAAAVASKQNISPMDVQPQGQNSPADDTKVPDKGEIFEDASLESDSSSSSEDSDKGKSYEGDDDGGRSSIAGSSASGKVVLTDNTTDKAQVEHPSSENTTGVRKTKDDDDNNNVMHEHQMLQEKQNKAIQVNEQESVTANHSHVDRTRVVVGQSDSRGRVKVMLGPRKRNSWVSKLKTGSAKGSGFHLLGNLGVSRWDEEDGNLDSKPAPVEREKIVQHLEKQEKSRKRKMHLDRWDSVLDQGKLKKTKTNPPAAKAPEHADQNPKKNIFQRIQSGIQKMNRGKAKGLFRRKGQEKKKKRHPR